MNNKMLERWKLKTKGIFHKIVYDEFWLYIDNLMKENERLKELCDEYEEEHSNEFQCWKRDRKELLDKRERIQKAIEYNKEIVDNYLEEDDCEYCDGRYASAKHNLNILQNGSDSQ